MEASVTIHLISAMFVLICGGLQLIAKKGTKQHKVIGWAWMLSMIIVAVSSFGIDDGLNWFYGYGPIHLLSIWVLFCVYMALTAIKKGEIMTHKNYTTGAFIGTIGAGVAAMLIPGRVLNLLIA